MGEFLEKLNPNVFLFAMIVIIGVGFAISLHFLREKK